jgi:hypothetical protein
MTAPKPSRGNQTTDYLPIGAMTMAIYLMMLWIAHYLPEELGYIWYLVHGLLLLALAMLWVGYRQYQAKNRPQPIIRKPQPPRPTKPSP